MGGSFVGRSQLQLRRHLGTDDGLFCPKDRNDPCMTRPVTCAASTQPALTSAIVMGVLWNCSVDTNFTGTCQEHGADNLTASACLLLCNLQEQKNSEGAMHAVQLACRSEVCQEHVCARDHHRSRNAALRQPHLISLHPTQACNASCGP
jgi:hypothetical protein